MKVQLVSYPVDPLMSIAPGVEIPEVCNCGNLQVCGLLEHVDFKICRSGQFHKYELYTASRVREDKASVLLFRGLPARQLTRLGDVQPRLLLHLLILTAWLLLASSLP